MLTLHEPVFLGVGELVVARGECNITTVLGSCVSVVAWHKTNKIGAMSHYLLPVKNNIHCQLNAYHFGSHALEKMLLTLSGIAPLDEFEFSLFGGAKILEESHHAITIGRLNVYTALDWAKANNIHFKHVCALKHWTRKVTFNLQTGTINCKKILSPALSLNHMRL